MSENETGLKIIDAGVKGRFFARSLRETDFGGQYLGFYWDYSAEISRGTSPVSSVSVVKISTLSNNASAINNEFHRGVQLGSGAPSFHVHHFLEPTLKANISASTETTAPKFFVELLQSGVVHQFKFQLSPLTRSRPTADSMEVFETAVSQVNKPDQVTMRPDCVLACIDFGGRHVRYMEGQIGGRTDR